MARHRAIQPHIEANGIDLCAEPKTPVLYVIRSDLGCYMKCRTDLHFPPSDGGLQKYEVYPLHPACSWGDHYIKGDDYFFIIKKDKFIAVTSLDQPQKCITEAPLGLPGHNYLKYQDKFIGIII